ncbi:MAG: hypothetical protein ACLQEQ_09840 [Nitrososphaerales archaeon]
MKSVAFYIDCSELSMDEELALASEISDSLKGQGVALVNGGKIIFDSFGEGPLDEKAVESVVSEFVAGRKGREFYSVERIGDSLAVHSANPMEAPRRRPTEKLPPNLLKCPFCPFVTPYQELYVVHTRSHGVGF